ncbi:MAG: hypothetical protein ACON35_00815 [Candidatus Marinamargulisbacteria bacterium]
MIRLLCLVILCACLGCSKQSDPSIPESSLDSFKAFNAVTKGKKSQ